MKHWPLLTLCACAAVAGGCTLLNGSPGSGPSNGGGGDGGGGGGGGPDVRPVTGAAADYTYALSQSSDAVRLWTTPTSVKVFPETARSAIPSNTDDELRIYAAGNEFEPVQLVIWSRSGGTCGIVPPSFGLGETVTIHSVEFVTVTTSSDSAGSTGLWPDPLIPRQPGEAFPLREGQNTPVWLTIELPENAPAGDHSASLSITAAGEAFDVPVRLHVFAFSLPRGLSVPSAMGLSREALGGDSMARLDEISTFLYEHRLTPSQPTSPGSLGPGVAFDCAAETLDDTIGAPLSFAQLAPRYVDGQGWNDVGFPCFEVLRYTAADAPRPETLCGLPIGDAYGTAAYNLKWQHYLAALDAYLVDREYASRAYYLLADSPQDAAAFDLAAYLSEMTRAVAPHLRIAVGSEPRAELYANATYAGAGFDTWICSLSAYDEATAVDRQSDHDEQVWWRPTAADVAPLLNPATIDHRGLEARLLGFALFKHRVDGLAYHDLTGWGDPWTDPWVGEGNGDGFLLYPEPGTTQATTRFIPSIRLELLREALEDYEYLRLANGANRPAAGAASTPDPTVDSVIDSLVSWTWDDEGFADLRKELGRYIAGERSDLPVLPPPGGPPHPRGEYHINFQDPAGAPTADPLVVGGAEYMKVGWAAYDSAVAYGWIGGNVGSDSLLCHWIAGDNTITPLQRSIIYDETGALNTFEFALENGAYEVTVSVGWADRGYYRDQSVAVEGVPVIQPGDATSALLRFYIKRTKRVELADGMLTVEMGGAERDGEPQLTMLNYLDIVPSD